ncbi:hypothetical protein MRS44_018442 [Fusarium solani]|uniref:uncharacterized protein n=1 Tax=Fusarium solani TaxID=169388 RepID=UPI0032C420BF|nr:hypothetical protein MRS44_018442 [Fusarium solani]
MRKQDTNNQKRGSLRNSRATNKSNKETNHRIGKHNNHTQHHCAIQQHQLEWFKTVSDKALKRPRPKFSQEDEGPSYIHNKAPKWIRTPPRLGRNIVDTLDRTTPHLVKWVKCLTPESLVQVTGTLQQPHEPIRSVTDSGLEVAVYSVHLVDVAHGLLFDNSVLEDQGFVEIHTPKLQPAAIESGSEMFEVSYYSRRAVLAQSQQLANQMAIAAGLRKCTSIPAQSNNRTLQEAQQDLTECTSLDVGMTLGQSYNYSMPELQVVRDRWPSKDVVWLDETPIIPFTEVLQMLRNDGRDIEGEDLSTRDERIHDEQKIRKSMEHSQITEDDKQEYITGFDLVEPSPAVALPQPPALDAETTKPELRNKQRPIVDTTANSGNATNVTQLDDPFEIWRHYKGAAVGYVRQNQFAIMAADPLDGAEALWYLVPGVQSCLWTSCSANSL